MDKINTILNCYGKEAFDKNIEIRLKDKIYNAWLIESINTKEELQKIYKKEQIIQIYEYGI